MKAFLAQETSTGWVLPVSFAFYMSAMSRTFHSSFHGEYMNNMGHTTTGPLIMTGVFGVLVLHAWDRALGKACYYCRIS